ncbi:hypothetical protein J3S90_00700 [Flavobacterium sp. P4023]|uniref:Prolyl-tRNA synthetase n=1 Tax=Flavobacterium flabelliforme TaxID=2816119 RepID=A0ABS5CNX6_9FLAO|nr:hypothetical protein [Flavobacterium flabelliforme]MBP4140321.1 hypothetical protein [Flavobacterium flabelliforme]
MKTNTLSPRNTSIYYFVVFFSVLLTSCGSYQNSSYYDSDGIYGSSSNRTIETRSQNNSYDRNQYKDYFATLQKDNTSDEIFTNVDDYSSYDLNSESVQNNDTNYPGWGSNPQNISINFNDNNWYGNYWYGNNWYGNNWYRNYWGWNGGYGWGLNVGLGWNNYYGNGFYGNSYYGNGYYGNAYYGNGYYGNSYYGNNWTNSNYYNSRTRSYNSSRRGSTYDNAGINGRNSGTYSRTQNNNNNRRTINSENRQSTDFNRNSSSRTSPTFSRNPQQTPNYPQNNTQSAPRRGNTNNGRIESTTPTRTYSPEPRYDNSSRSYNNTRSSGSETRSSGGETRSSGSRGGRSGGRG